MEVTRTFDLLERFRELYPSKSDVFAAKRNGKWDKVSTSSYLENVNYVSYGLMALGFKKGDKIASVSNNRPEWNYIDMGMAQIGVIHVPVYPNISEDEYVHIFNHSEVTCLIVSDKSILSRLKPAIDKSPGIQTVYSFNNGTADTRDWMEIVELGKKSEAEYAATLETIKNSITENDIFTLIYTSGTTGNSKGVMLNHRNIVSNFVTSSKIQPLDSSHKVISFLPLCHIYERMMNYHFQYKGISIYYAESLGTIVDNIQEIKADGFNSVPRVLERVYDRFIQKGKDLPWLKRKIYFWAVKLGLRYNLNSENGWWYETKLKFADKMIYSKWRQAFGGNVKIIVSGGSALQPRIERLFWAAKMKIMEGYGLTETSPVIAVNYPEYPNVMFGTVGPVLEDVQVKIAEDGEILTKGPNLMMGYYKDPEYTKTVIDEEGWFHTGDIGYLVDNKFLKITDRKKEIFKLSAGKYIAPQVIENLIKESNFIEQAMVVGENEKFASALVSPNFNYLHFWASKHKVHFRDNMELVQKPEVISRFQKEIDHINKKLGQHEKIKRFRLVCEEWSPGTGEVSPTLKLRRAFIYKKYEHILKEIYRYGNGNGNAE